MRVAVTCESCGKKYKISKKFGGKKFACKGCSTAISVPVVESGSTAAPKSSGKRAFTPAGLDDSTSNDAPSDRERDAPLQLQRPKPQKPNPKPKPRPAAKKKSNVVLWDDDPFDDDADGDNDLGEEFEQPKRRQPKSKRKSARRKTTTPDTGKPLPKKKPPRSFAPLIFAVIGLGVVVALAGYLLLPGKDVLGTLLDEQLAMASDMADVVESIQTVDDAKAVGTKLDSLAERLIAFRTSSDEFFEQQYEVGSLSLMSRNSSERTLATLRRQQATRTELTAISKRSQKDMDRIMADPKLSAAVAAQFAALRKRHPSLRSIQNTRFTMGLQEFGGPSGFNGMADKRGSHTFGQLPPDPTLVTINFTQATAEQTEMIPKRVLEIARGASDNCTITATRYSVTIRPIKDFDAFVKCIDFGDVGPTNSTTLRINVVVNPPWKFQPGAGPVLQ